MHCSPTPYQSTTYVLHSSSRLHCFSSMLAGLYGNEGLLPARWQLRYSGKPLVEQLLSSPTLLWLGPRLGLDTHTAMELLCLVGAALSLAATLVEAFRDSVVFFCLWVLYMSMYQVSVCDGSVWVFFSCHNISSLHFFVSYR